MKIYSLTPLGSKLARSISNPDTPGWRIVHFLDKHDNQTTDSIANYCGLSPSEAAVALRSLSRMRPPIVTEISRRGV